MPAVHEVDLACRIINEHFGKQTELVVATLLKKGRQSFAELLSACNTVLSHQHTCQQVPLTRSVLKQLLLVLLQQNCIRSYLQPAEVRVAGVRPAVYLYEADLLQILQIIRRPKFLQHIKDDTPTNGGAAAADVSSVIVEVLLEHGRLRYDQIRSAVVSRLTHDNPAAAAAAAAVKQEGGAEGGQQQQQPAKEQSPASAAAEYAEAVRWSFVQLLQEHYIERAPPCNLPPPQHVSAAPSKAKKTAPKPGSLEYAEQQSKAMQQLAHKTYEESRFKAPRELVAGMGTEDDDVMCSVPDAANAPTASKPTRKRKKVAGGVTEDAVVAAAAAAAAQTAAANAAVAKQAAALANKRRKTAAGKAEKANGNAADAAAAIVGDTDNQQAAVLKQEDGVSTSTTPPSAQRSKAAMTAAAAEGDVDPPTAAEMLWRVNPEEFNRRFRNKVMADLVTDKLGADAGTVLGAMLSHGRRYETRVQGDVSIAMGLPEVLAALKAGQDTGRLMQLSEGAEVENLVKALAFDSLGAVDSNSVGPSGASYVVNMRAILDRARLLQLHAVLRDKFGIHGLRIFNTLMWRGQLEQKQIADIAMHPHKETRELLYRMFRAGYMQLQDIPRTSDRAPSRCFYTWHVEIKAAFERLAADLYHAAANLHARRTHEMDKHAELVELVESARAAGQLNFNMTDSQRRALERLGKVSGALETSLLRLDSMIALFNEF